MILGRLVFFLCLCSCLRAGGAPDRRLFRHPARIGLLLRRSVGRLVTHPREILSCGIPAMPGSTAANERVLKRTLARVSICDVSYRYADEAQFVSGHADSLRFSVTGLDLRPMKAKRVLFRIQDLFFDVDTLLGKGRLRVRKAGPVRVEIEIGTTQLRHLVPSRYSLRISGGLLYIEGRVRLLLFSTFFSLAGSIVSEDGYSLSFRPKKLNVGNLPFAQLFRMRATRGLNPLFNLRTYLGRALKVVDVRFTRVRLGDGLIRVFISARIPFGGACDQMKQR